MFGSVGLLPALGAVGSGIASGGSSALGLTMMSGLLNTMIRPKDPSSLSAFAGLVEPSAFGPFGSLRGGPNVTTASQFSTYIGQPYASGDASPSSSSPAGLYFGNAGYHFGTHGISYGSNASSSNDLRSSMGRLDFAGDLGAYQQTFAALSTAYPEAASAASYNTFGSAMAPYSQSFAPMLTPYSSGFPQTYNSAGMLAAYQNGTYLPPNQTPPPGYFSKQTPSSGVSLAAAIVGDSGGSESAGDTAAAEQ